MISLDGGTPVSPSSGTVTFSNVGTLNYNASNKSATHTLTFSAPLGASEIAGSINLNVVFEQVI